MNGGSDCVIVGLVCLRFILYYFDVLESFGVGVVDESGFFGVY